METAETEVRKCNGLRQHLFEQNTKIKSPQTKFVLAIRLTYYATVNIHIIIVHIIRFYSPKLITLYILHHKLDTMFTFFGDLTCDLLRMTRPLGMRTRHAELAYCKSMCTGEYKECHTVPRHAAVGDAVWAINTT